MTKKSTGTTPLKKDTTAAQRTAKHKQLLIAAGGKRMSINFDGKIIKKLNVLIKKGYGENYSDVIRNLTKSAITHS
jgi:hypothetical protein